MFFSLVQDSVTHTAFKYQLNLKHFKQLRMSQWNYTFIWSTWKPYIIC